jgi:hypothetical protein
MAPFVRVAMRLSVVPVIFVLMLVRAPSSFAGYAEGNHKYLGCFSGHCYDNYSAVKTDDAIRNLQAYAYEVIYTNSGNNAPAGYMGAAARLFHNGAVCKQTNWNYNPGAANNWVVYAGDAHPTACGAGSYYSGYETGAWVAADSAYDVELSDLSPSQTAH